MNNKRAYDPHRDLLELHGLERPACANTLVPRGSHHISSLWSPVVATRGNRSQTGRARKRRKQAESGRHRVTLRLYRMLRVHDDMPSQLEALGRPELSDAVKVVGDLLAVGVL